MNEHHVPMEPPPDVPEEQQALHVLTMAQRTAEEHLASARSQADRICSEAQQQAAKIVRDAQARAEASHHEADRVLSEAHAAAAQVVEDARAQAQAAQHEAERIVADAQLQANDIANHAKVEADELGQLAKQRYDDVVGSLAARREGLQQQIEALERFDREYRARLQAFMQSQLRALWFDDPRIDPEALGPVEEEPAESAVASVPVPRDGGEEWAEEWPEPRHADSP